jgi:hypothetical protein
VVTIEKYVLGIDAAWTVKNPSGVALLKWFPNSKPELVRAGRSYDEFCNIGKADWQNSIGDSKHSPSSDRPGDISTNIFKLLTENGFSWACGHITTPAFIEVFPHVAIIELFDYDQRYFKPNNSKCYASLLPASPESMQCGAAFEKDGAENPPHRTQRAKRLVK